MIIFIKHINRLLAKGVAIPLMKVYHVVGSPFFAIIGSRCRFYPTCSHYAEEAFNKHGFISGLFLTVTRVAKCNPLHPGGFDPVPDKDKSECCEHQVQVNINSQLKV